MSPRCKKAIATLFNAFIIPGEKVSDQKAMLQLYEVAVEEIADEFLEMATKDFIKGTVEGASRKFRPQPAEFAGHARDLQSEHLVRLAEHGRRQHIAAESARLNEFKHEKTQEQRCEIVTKTLGCTVPLNYRGRRESRLKTIPALSKDWDGKSKK